jgi:trans-aconitate methyltransferase
MSDQMKESPLASTAANYLKYQTRNPIVRRLIGNFFDRVRDRIRETRPARIVDIGCGEGALAAQLGTLGFPVDYRGYDISAEAVATARRLHPDRCFIQANLFDASLEVPRPDLIVCLEVLEHLPQPDRAVDKLASWTNRAALLSVPWEPYFQLGSFLRGKYLATWGNHPDHLHRFDKERFTRLAQQGFGEVRVEPCFPWLIATCFRRDR